MHFSFCQSLCSHALFGVACRASFFVMLSCFLYIKVAFSFFEYFQVIKIQMYWTLTKLSETYPTQVWPWTYKSVHVSEDCSVHFSERIKKSSMNNKTSGHSGVKILLHRLCNPQMTATWVYIKKEQNPLKTVKRRLCAVAVSFHQTENEHHGQRLNRKKLHTVIVPALQKRSMGFTFQLL